MDTLRPILRAAAIAAFTVGVLLMLLNPPSLSGAGGLMTLIVGAAAFVLFAAWGTLPVRARPSMSEREFDRLGGRSEARARPPPGEAADATEFELLVADAIDSL